MTLHLSPEITRVFAVVLALLAIASGVAFVLRRAVAKGKPNPTIDNLVARIDAWWVMVGVLLLAFALGERGVIALFALSSFFALREFITLTYTRRGDHSALALGFFVVLPVQYWLIAIRWYGLYSVFIPVYAFLVLPIAAAISQDSKRFLERAAKVQWGLMICVFCISHVPALLTLEIPGYPRERLPLLIFFLVAIAQGSDVLQYVFGKLTGRHKVAPALSPSKTVEGLVGGVATATAIGAALSRLTPFSPLAAAGLAFVICVMGFLGGLVMSAIKRDRGVKDWGSLIEGHGGMLDRVDSICFAAPVFFHLVRYWYAA